MEFFDTQELQALDARHHLHPFTDHHDLHQHGTRIITGANNIYLYDSDGKKYLDGMAGLWCVNIGYGRTELAEVAKHQMEQLPYYNTFFQSSTPPAIELAEMLAELTPSPLHRVFFGCSGSDGNDTVIRLVRYFWKLQGQASRTVLISRKNAYHGSTLAGASLGGMQTMHAIGGLPIPDIAHVDQPYHYREGGDLDPQAFGLQSARSLETKILELGTDRVAAFIAEPVQGAGGVIVPPDSYWPEIVRICRKYDVLLVSDEVITGFGRTGEWFGCQTYDFEPDVMTLAKGLSSGYQPIGAVMVSDRIAEALDQEGREFTHGYTYSGHPVACAVATRNLQILRDERIVEQARDQVMDYFQSRIRELADHPLVGEVRGKGFLGAIELVKDKASKEKFDTRGGAGIACRGFCADNGLIMRAVGDSMILCPPLIIRRPQVDELIQLIHASLDQTESFLARA